MTFKRILIANRGEIAVRIIRACQEMGIETVAVYSEADSTALHPALADTSVSIGPPAPGESYLHGEKIIAAALAHGAEAIHPGYGFLSESAAFARQVQAAGLLFIGPDPSAMEAMGNKTSARAHMRAAGVPVVPGFEGGDSSVDYQNAARRLGYPVLVKAAAGGGGKGMRLVEEEADLPLALAAAQREAQNAFGDGRIYLEKYLVNPRHVEFQILADRHGQTIHLFERECSVQRRHQKIIEETPSPFLALSAGQTLRQQMGAAAITAAQAVNYVNAGTVEFLVDDGGNFYFLEMNTRLQVEHPITESVLGIDLVKAQIRIAAGEPLPYRQADIYQHGHAIECRIYAEDPAQGFLPSTGKLLRVVAPMGPRVRVDTGIITGMEITRYYDPLIAKLIVWGENRADALQKMAWALSHYVILGPATNISFLGHILDQPEFQAGQATTQFIEGLLARADWSQAPAALPDRVLIAAAVAQFIEQRGPRQTNGAAGDSNGDTYNPWRQVDGFRVGGA